MTAEARSWATGITSALLATVVLATGNLSGVGIGTRALLYDADALPRLVAALVLTACAWAAWWMGATAEETPRMRIDPVWALLGGLAVWAALSAVVSPHRMLTVLGQSERLEGVVTIVLYAAVYGLGLQVVRRAEDLRRLLTWFCAACSLLAAYGVLQFLGVDPADHTLAGIGFSARRAFATFGNPNFFAALLVIAWPCAAAMALNESRPAARKVWGGAAVLMLSALLVTFTRTAWVVAALQVVAGTVVWRRAGGRWDAGARIGVAAAVIALAALAALSIGSGQETDVLARLREATSNAGSVVERAEVAKVALAAAADQPVTGFGPDAFLPAFRMFRTDAYARTFGPTGTVNNAHSWPLQFLATLGAPGAALLLAALILPLLRGRHHLRVGEGGSGGRFIMAGVFVACAGYAVVMLATVSVIGASLPFWLLLGAMGAPGSREVGVARGLGRAALVLTAVAGILSAVIGVRLLLADASFLASRDAFHAGDHAAAAELAERAHRLNPLSVKYDRGAAQARAAGVTGAAGPVDRRAMAAAANRFDAVVRRHPRDYPAHAWAAALYAESAAASGSEEHARRARELATAAAALDRQNAALSALAAGEVSQRSVASAEAVPALP